MLRAGSNGNVGEGGLSNLPVCRIFKRGSDGYSSCSLRSGEAEFLQLFLILQVPDAAKQSIPCFALTSLRATVRFTIAPNNL